VTPIFIIGRFYYLSVCLSVCLSVYRISDIYVDCVNAGHFNIYTREAGAGGLSIAVEGPSKAEIDFQDHKDGSCEVAYTCTEPGVWSHIHVVSLQSCCSINPFS